MSAPGQVAAGTGEQFYVTHCVTADSVLGSPGYGVRAASAAGDPGTLRLALEYPPYELPIDLWKDKPAKAHTPRRLARTRHPTAGVWVAHSVYLEKDTMGRDRSYFTHLMSLPAAVGAAEVLESWDAPGWAKDYPLGAAKALPKATPPAGTAVSTKALTDFLSGPQTGPADLAVATCPVRLRPSPEARRELVGTFLHAVVLAAQAGAGRDRVYVHAEPGLVALLLYAAVRILPPVFTPDLTFSTFEPYHRNIRDYKAAAVVGTFIGAPGKGLDPDLTRARGFGLDTFLPERSSPELGGGLPAGLNELLDLAASGQWEVLENIHRMVGRGDDVLARIGETITRAQALGRVEAGNPTADDLLALREAAGGPGVPPGRAEKMKPFVWAAALTDPRIRAGFRDWLADDRQLTEYRREAAAALAAGDLAGWDSRWAVVRDATDPGQRRHQLERALKSLDTDHLPTLGPGARVRLRAACRESGVPPEDWHHLFAPTGPDELDALLEDDVPADWRGYACFAVMGPDENNWLLESTRPHRPAMRSRVRKYLFAAPTEVLGEYARHARPHLDAEAGFLADLFKPYTPACRPLMHRLLGTTALAPDDWVRLIPKVNLYGGDWDGFLMEGDRLTLLLVALGGAGAGAEVWRNYLELLSPALLSPEFAGAEVHAWERHVHARLQAAADRLSRVGVKLVNALPKGGVKKLFAATDLIKWVENPAVGDKLGDGDVRQACDNFNAVVPEGDGEAARLEPFDLLRAALLRGKFQTLSPPADTPTLAPFVALFRAAYPIDPNFRSSSLAVTEWLRLSQECPEGTRAAFQAYLVTEYVPRGLRRQILDESRREPMHPGAAALIGDGLAVPDRKPAGEKYRPAGKRARSSEEDDAAFASPATKRAKKVKKPKARGGCFGLVLVVAAVIGAIVVGV